MSADICVGIYFLQPMFLSASPGIVSFFSKCLRTHTRTSLEVPQHTCGFVSSSRHIYCEIRAGGNGHVKVDCDETISSSQNESNPDYRRSWPAGSCHYINSKYHQEMQTSEAMTCQKTARYPITQWGSQKSADSVWIKKLQRFFSCSGGNVRSHVIYFKSA